MPKDVCEGCGDTISTEEIRAGSDRDMCVACFHKTPEERKARFSKMERQRQQFREEMNKSLVKR